VGASATHEVQEGRLHQSHCSPLCIEPAGFYNYLLPKEPELALVPALKRILLGSAFNMCKLHLPEHACIAKVKMLHTVGSIRGVAPYKYQRTELSLILQCFALCTQIERSK
jgi:hypothetical protein